VVYIKFVNGNMSIKFGNFTAEKRVTRPLKRGKKRRVKHDFMALPSTSCDELSKLGYTLNGYYTWSMATARMNRSFIAISLFKLVDCMFNKPIGKGKQQLSISITIIQNYPKVNKTS